MNDAALPLGDVENVAPTLSGGLGVEFRLRRASVILRPLTDEALLLSVRFDDPKLQLSTSRRRYALLSQPWPGAPLEIREGREDIHIRSGRILIRAERSPFRLSYAHHDGEEFLSEVAGGGLRHGYWEVGAHFQLPPGEAFYGLGQADQRPAEPPQGDSPARSGVPINHRGLHLPIWHWHQPPSRVILPMLLSSRRYGLLIDNPVKACWDLGAGNPDRFSYVAEGGLLNLVVFAGDSLKHLIDIYTSLTGRFPIPPRWALGYLQSRYGYRDEGELLEVAGRLRARDIPCDGLILDLHWFDQMGDLAFDRTRWPAPEEMIRRLQGDGFHLVLIEEPYLTEHSRLYPEARARGLLCRRPDGTPYLMDNWPGRMALVDFSNPEAQRWWTDEHIPLIQMGVDGHWLDLVEPMDQPIDMCHAGGPAIMTHNRFVDQMVYSVANAWQKVAPDRRPFIMTRAGYAGIQRTGLFLWSGDVESSWEALATQVALGQNAGLAGFAGWNSDVGGFGRQKTRPEDLSFNQEHQGQLDEAEDAELYLRWLQFGIFCPLLRVHSDEHRRREPWVFGPDVEAIARQLIQLRYRMLPYIYSCYFETYRSGLPIIRPMVLHYEDDPVTPSLTDQYLFGPNLLIAPVLAPGARSRRVYLPAGQWYDGWTEQFYQGPQWVEVDTPLDRIPMFIPAGAILPFGPHQSLANQHQLDALTIHVYAGADGSFELYEDDGNSHSYRRGEYCLTPIRSHACEGEWSITVEGCEGRHEETGHPRMLRFWLHGISELGGIHRDERPLPGLASRDAWRKVKAGWWYYAERRMVGVKIPLATGPVTLRLWERHRRNRDKDDRTTEERP